MRILFTSCAMTEEPFPAPTVPAITAATENNRNSYVCIDDSAAKGAFEVAA